MDQRSFFIDEHSLHEPVEGVFLQPRVPEWQQFMSSQSKYQMQKDELFNSRSQFPPETPEKHYIEQDDFYTERNNTITQSSPSSAYSRAENTDFLSAIPYARSSYTVKRKLNYEDESFKGKGVPKNVINQNTKTYFPFEFIGHATRKSNDMIRTASGTKENEKIIHPTMITGRAFRKTGVNESAFQTFTTNQPKTPTALGKLKGKNRMKKGSNRQVALEKHAEQIRRKHAEFNWNVREPQQTFEKCYENNFSLNDLDSQRVPSSPFLERFTPPSLYSMSEAPLTLAQQMKRSSTNFAAGTQNYENRANQQNQHDMEKSPFAKRWCGNVQELTENICNETENFHLYPY